jgi:UDP-N-acetylmuramate: L-alanyl-gamma-D-glutamyl-meso-diaminopimelate ligase
MRFGLTSDSERIKKRMFTPRSIHIVGVCGTLMGAFAAYLRRAGVAVTGSDENCYPPMSDVLERAGVKLMNGYRAENIAHRPELIVIGNVIRRDNPEAVAALASGIPYTSLPEFMERYLLQKTRNLVVAGTHGKTTTSSLLSHVLNQCAQNPSYFIGGVPQDLPQSFHVDPTSRHFVLEGDEYDTAFWDKVPKFNHYLPDDAILTSVEFDHADIYADLAAVERAFEGLLERIRPGGRLIACVDYPSVRKLLPRAKVPVLTYGTGGDARFTLGALELAPAGVRFDVLDQGRAVDQIKLQMPGKYNALNALAVWIECRELGLPGARVLEALASFRGVKRRQEVRANVHGVLVIDDFAHHPTAVRETLAGLAAKYSGRRLLVVFEPRSATSRRKVFQKEYAQAFDAASEIFIAAPYDQSRIAAHDQFSAEELISDLRGRGKSAKTFAEVEIGVNEVARSARSGDVLAILSNGGFGGFIPKLIGILDKK